MSEFEFELEVSVVIRARLARQFTVREAGRVLPATRVLLEPHQKLLQASRGVF